LYKAPAAEEYMGGHEYFSSISPKKEDKRDILIFVNIPFKV